jgi:hypothetical protein
MFGLENIWGSTAIFFDPKVEIENVSKVGAVNPSSSEMNQDNDHTHGRNTENRDSHCHQQQDGTLADREDEDLDFVEVDLEPQAWGCPDCNCKQFLVFTEGKVTHRICSECEHKKI